MMRFIRKLNLALLLGHLVLFVWIYVSLSCLWYPVAGPCFSVHNPQSTHIVLFWRVCTHCSIAFSLYTFCFSTLFCIPRLIELKILGGDCHLNTGLLKWLSGLSHLVIHSTLEIGVYSCTERGQCWFHIANGWSPRPISTDTSDNF